MATSSPSANSRTVAGWATDERISAIASTDSPRRDDRRRRRAARRAPRRTSPRPIGRVSIRMPRRRGERRLGLPAAGRVVAVGQQDDPLLRVVGEQRGGEAQGARRCRSPISTGVEASRSISSRSDGQPLDERVLAERDDPGHVAIRHLLEGLAQERERVLAAGVPDRVGEVDDEHRREPVDRQDELEPGDREDERRQQQRPDDERRRADGPRPCAGARRGGGRSSARAPGPAAAAQSGSVEGDAHQAVPPSGRRPSAPAERAPDADDARRGGRCAHSMQSPTSTMSTIGIHSSSRVVGRSAAGDPGAAEAPGPTAVAPSASMAAARTRRDRRLPEVEEVDREADRRARIDDERRRRGGAAARRRPRDGASARRRRTGPGSAATRPVGVTV